MSKKTGDKVVDAIGLDTKNEMDAMTSEELKARVVQANQAMKQVKEELAANEQYQALKENLKALSSGKREVDKRQKAIITYALRVLEEKGSA